jgi:stress response protein YsnF/sporulation protein YlmC with PRC-barrel domain
VQTDIDPRDLIGHKAVDRNGDKIGTVDEVYLDDATGEPEWAAVRTGIFGRDAFVPLTTSEFSGEELRVPYDKSLIKESPDFGVGQHLSPAQELQLYRYYGLDAPTGGRGSAHARPAHDSSDRADDMDFGVAAPAAPATPAAPVTSPAAPADDHRPSAPAATTERERMAGGPEAPAAHREPTIGLDKPAAEREPTIGLDKPVEPRPAPTPPPPEPTYAPAAREPGTAQGPDAPAPSAPVELTLREERLEITNQWHVLGTARMRKYVVTEPVEHRVQVVRERVRVERVPVGATERAALSERDIAEAVEEVTLREERPVVRKYLAPLERVRLVVERFTEEQVIKDELRRERVEIHDTTGSVRSGDNPH